MAVLGNNGQYLAVYDLRAVNKVTSGLSIGNTIFICIILGGGAMIFTNQCNTLVVGPIEKMIKKVIRISENPLLAAQEEENEAL